MKSKAHHSNIKQLESTPITPSRWRGPGGGLFYLFLFTYLLTSCANPGTSLSGGDKDEIPPEVVTSTPENYSTNFTAQEVKIEFNEFLKPGNVKQKLIISPVMDEMPEIKIKGKVLLITFSSELMADRTYTLNFGDAIADLNESNPIENFMYVFSTGDELDSLEIAGYVQQAINNEPLEGAAVMLYQVDNDSLPLTELPIYLSITNEEGQFHLKNLASGSYKIFALKDANSNYLFDQPKEEIAYLDTLITPGVTVIEPKKDTTAQTAMVDSLDQGGHPELVSGTDSTGTIINDTTAIVDTLDQGGHPELVSGPDSTGIMSQNDSLLINKAPKQPTHNYYPKNLLLKSFTEIYKKQYITSTDRTQANKIEVAFNQPLDSLELALLSDSLTPSPYPYDLSSKPYAFNYPPTRDSLTIWLHDSTLYNRDTITYSFTFTAYDSIENPYTQIDTVAFSFRKPQVKQEETPVNPFKITSNFNRTKELGQETKLFFTEPWQSIDTSKIDLSRTRDTLRIKQDFQFAPDTLTEFSITCHPPPVAGSQDSSKMSQKGVSPLSKLSLNLLNNFLVDSSYSLTLYPGAFKTYSGLTNDTTKISFKVANPDQYGTVLLNLDTLDYPVILQLIKGKDQVMQERIINEPGVQNFSNLKPGKYKFKIIFDKNNNGKWDPGRYLKGIKPEEVLYYGKELDVKANWELEESWSLSDE